MTAVNKYGSIVRDLPQKQVSAPITKTDPRIDDIIRSMQANKITRKAQDADTQECFTHIAEGFKALASRVKELEAKIGELESKDANR